MTTLLDLAKQFAKKYPARPVSRSSGSWDQLCGVLMIQFGAYIHGASDNQIKGAGARFWKTPPNAGVLATADLVRRNSGKLNKNHLKAPIGAFHFWQIGAAGHVGIDLRGRGQTIFMATTHLKERWGTALGVQSAVGYGTATGAVYMGWATNYAGGKLELPKPPAPKPAPAPAPKPDPAPEPEGPGEADIDDQTDDVDEPPPPPRAAVPDVDLTHAVAAAQLVSTLLPRKARDILYVVYGLVGVLLGAATTYLIAVQQLAPLWLVGAVAVYAYLGTFVAFLAKANVPKAGG